MKVKKFIAKTMPEAMQQIRNELGKDAVILKTREVKKGGMFGLFQKAHFEVVAALDPNPSRNKQASMRRTLANSDVHHEVMNEQFMQTPGTAEGSQSHILAEIKQMKQLLKVNQSSSTSMPSMLEVDYILPYTHLLDQEVDQVLAEEIVLSVQQYDLDHEKNMSTSEIKKAIENEIVQRLDDGWWEPFSFNERIIHFIGPTGVGKTTTLAKLAAKAKLENNKNVAFITTDTYRIAAIEQLRTYARILDIPLEVAYSKEDYIQALQKHSSVDQIFVDTAGRNFREQAFVEDLTDWLTVTEDYQATMLVLSLSTKQSDLEAIFNQFKHLDNQQIIFTKLDETDQFGSMINFAINEHAPIAFVTNGQDVPQDVIEPSARFIGSYVMSGYNDE